MKFIAFDLDGVLVDGLGSWREVHEALGTEKTSDIRYRNFLEGKIKFKEWAKKDCKLWEGTPKSQIKEILYTPKLMEGVRETLNTLKERGWTIGIISGGLQILADRIKEKFGLDYAIANELQWNAGKLNGVKLKVDFDGKGKVLQKVCQDYKIQTSKCTAVGDSINDIPLFKEAGFSIAFNPKFDSLEKYADKIIYEKDLRKVISIITSRN